MPLLVRVARVLFLEMPRIGQQNPRQVFGRLRTVDGARVALLHQDGQEPGMIEVRVRQHHGVERQRIERECFAVA